MRKVSIHVLTVAGLSATLFLTAHTQGKSSAQQSGKDSTLRSVTAFYCDRFEIKPELRKHKADLDAKLRSLRQETREIPDGFEFKFPADAATFQTVSEWAALERLCCPFFDIDLRLEREKGPFWLRLTGREGVKPFIRSEFAPWVNQ